MPCIPVEQITILLQAGVLSKAEADFIIRNKLMLPNPDGCEQPPSKRAKQAKSESTEHPDGSEQPPSKRAKQAKSESTESV
jgi:hypothetical protein